MKNVIVSKLETNRDLLEVSMNKTSSKGYFINHILFGVIDMVFWRKEYWWRNCMGLRCNG